MKEFKFAVQDTEGTDRLGSALARHLPPGAVVALVGTLGAGKTRLVRAVAAAVGVDARTVVSPTFVLMQQYVADRCICHLDAYRIKDNEEFSQLGPDELFQTDELVFIEWADRIEQCLPTDHFTIQIDVDGETSRVFKIVSHVERHADVIRKIAQQLGVD